MGAVREFHDATVRLLQILEEHAEKEREDKLNELEVLLDQREKSLKKIKPPFTKDDEELVKKTFALNDRLLELLKKEKDAIEKDMNRLKKRRKTNKIYINPYASLQGIEGAYYDKKN